MLPLEVAYSFDPIPPEPEQMATPMSRSSMSDMQASPCIQLCSVSAALCSLRRCPAKGMPTAPQSLRLSSVVHEQQQGAYTQAQPAMPVPSYQQQPERWAGCC